MTTGFCHDTVGKLKTSALVHRPRNRDSHVEVPEHALIVSTASDWFDKPCISRGIGEGEKLNLTPLLVLVLLDLPAQDPIMSAG